jgi:hypothetical protein
MAMDIATPMVRQAQKKQLVQAYFKGGDKDMIDEFEKNRRAS